MPLRKRTSPVVNGDADNDPGDADLATDPADAMALAEEAEAEAAEAEALAAAARARARALKLRRQAEAAAATAKADAASEASAATGEVAAAAMVAGPADVDETETTEAPADETPDEPASAEPAPRRRLKLPRIRLKVLVAGLVIALSLGLLGVSGWMTWHHRQVVAEQQRSAEFGAAARQSVVTLMSLDFNHAEDDVKRIIDNTTGDFKKDFESQAADFTNVAKQSKVVTEATVNSTAVQSMTKDTATVLVAVTTNVSNLASKEQQPRSWRLSVDMARDGGQIKLAKVEFVP